MFLKQGRNELGQPSEPDDIRCSYSCHPYAGEPGEPDDTRCSYSCHSYAGEPGEPDENESGDLNAFFIANVSEAKME
jgi:hypothetical protein